MNPTVTRTRYAIERIVLCFWIGGIWTVGYVVAPVLFQLISRVQAGTVAGRLFSIMSVAGLICGGLLLASLAWDARRRVFRQWRGLLLGAMLLVIAIAQFVLEPQMSALREAGLNGANYMAFMRLHGISQILFLLVSLGGLLLVVLGLRTDKT